MESRKRIESINSKAHRLSRLRAQRPSCPTALMWVRSTGCAAHKSPGIVLPFEANGLTCSPRSFLRDGQQSRNGRKSKTVFLRSSPYLLVREIRLLVLWNVFEHLYNLIRLVDKNADAWKSFLPNAQLDAQAITRRDGNSVR